MSEVKFEWLDDIIEKKRKHYEWQKTLALSDPRHDAMASIDDNGILIVWWGGYDWWIDLKEIKTPLNFLGLLDHLTMKEWEHANEKRIRRLINLVSNHKGWKIHPF